MKNMMMNQKMATYNSMRNEVFKPPHNLSLDQCDACGSSDIFETKEGYVCRHCGIVLEIQRLEYYRPYIVESVHHEVLNKTQMGFYKERRVMQNSHYVERLNKIDRTRENAETLKQSMRIELKRLMNGLQLPYRDIEVILKKAIEIRNKLGKGTKFRAPDKLIPCVLYFHYKSEGRPIRELPLLELVSLTKKEFNNFKLQLLEMWPKYQERNRLDYIMHRLLGLWEHFGLDMSYFHQSKKILYRFYDSIKNTKDDVIIGLVSSITLLCSDNEEVCVNNICERLNIKMSTIQTQVKRRIFDRFKVKGYESLIKSKDILKGIIRKKGMLNPEFLESNSQEEEEIVEKLYNLVSLGSAKTIFNMHDNKEYYINMVKLATENELFIVLVSKPVLDFVLENNTQGKIKKVDHNNTVKVELWKFQYPTGPPVDIS